MNESIKMSTTISPSTLNLRSHYPIEEIKKHLDLVGLAQQLHPGLKKHGGLNNYVYQGNHVGVHPSQNGQCLVIWPHTGSWKCFNCGQSGDAIDLLGVYLFGTGYRGEGDEFNQAVEEAARRAGVSLEPPTTEQLAVRTEQSRVYGVLTEAAHWFNRRLAAYPDMLEHLRSNYGLKDDFINQLSIGFAPPHPTSDGSKGGLVDHLRGQDYSLEEMQAASIINRGGYCRFQGRLVFPFWQAGRVIYFAARSTTHTLKNEHETYPNGEYKKYRKLKVGDEANPHISPWLTNDVLMGTDNLSLARKRGYALIVEGLPDQLAAHQAGEPALSPGTTHFTPAQLETVAHSLGGLKAYLCFDNEESGAGERGALETALALEERGVRTYLIKLPRPAGTSKIDVCEFLRDNEVAAFTDLYRTALRLPDYRLHHLPRPAESEGKAALVGELAVQAVELCRYDPISLTGLQQNLALALKVPSIAIRQIFKETTGAAGTKDSRWNDGSPRTAESEESERGEVTTKKSQATLVAELTRDFELFHTGEGRAYASFPVGDNDQHQETWAVRSRTFKTMLRRQFYLKYGSVPGQSALEDGLGVIEARAGEGEQLPVYNRLASYEGSIYFDLSNEKWEVVRIRPDGWEILSQSPVKFRRTSGMLAMPRPVIGGRLDDLREFINVSGPDWKLLAAWLVTALNPDCQYPVLSVSGEQGSAKSTASRFIRRLLDPSVTPLRNMPKDERDFWIGAQNSWLVAYDNLSGIPHWLSDTLCRVSTGGGNVARMLYSDDEEVFFAARRPVLLNGIDAVATRGDLLDRSIIISLPSISEENRQGEHELNTRFEAALPLILGGLLDTLSVALSRIGSVKLERRPRMADFAAWAVAAEPGFGGPEGQPPFLEIYGRQRQSSHLIALEASTLAQAFVNWYEEYRAGPGRFEGEVWEGTAGELLNMIEDSLDEEERRKITRQHSWPGNARALSVQLHRLAPNLRGLGMELEFDVYAGKLKRGIRISPVRSATTNENGTQSLSGGTQMGETSTQALESSTQTQPGVAVRNVENEAGVAQLAPGGTQSTQSTQIPAGYVVANKGNEPATGLETARQVPKNNSDGIRQPREICVLAYQPDDRAEQLTNEIGKVEGSNDASVSPVAAHDTSARTYRDYLRELAGCQSDYQALLAFKERVMASRELVVVQKNNLLIEVKARINQLLFPPGSQAERQG